MRRDGLFDRLVSFENLELAARRAQRGKRRKRDVATFELRRENEVLRLQDELRTGRYRHGRYYQFRIFEPKERVISKAPFRDRVMHHALCNVIEPGIERSFSEHSYACRVGKGGHRAVDRFQQLAKRHRYVLTCDIVKFFPSIDHTILRRVLRRRISDPRCLWLIDEILESSPIVEGPSHYFNGDDLFEPLRRRRGLPIGNLTSQFFANLYLNSLDHFVERGIGCRTYLRYCDDFVLFSDDAAELLVQRERIREFLGTVRLRLHPGKSIVRRTSRGVRFLGYRVFPSRRLVARENVVRFKRRLRRLRDGYVSGTVELEEIAASVRGWLAHAQHADSSALRESALRDFAVRRDTTLGQGSASPGRGVQQ